MKKRKPFAFKNFTIEQELVTLPVTTDACLFGAYCEFNNPHCILDIGTGTGILALMMNQKYPDAKIVGVEKHGPTAQQASRNIAINHKKAQIEVVEIDFFDHTPVNLYDAIISNPPFFSNQLQSATKLKNQARHLLNFTFSDFYLKISQVLKPNGKASVLLPNIEIESLKNDIKASELNIQSITTIQANAMKTPHLMIVDLGFNVLEKNIIPKNSIVMRSDNNKFTFEVYNLLNPFYLDQALNL